MRHRSERPDRKERARCVVDDLDTSGTGSGRLGLNEVILVLARQFFERFALRLGDEQGREDSRQHEQCEDLKHVGHERIFASAVLCRRKEDENKQMKKRKTWSMSFRSGMVQGNGLLSLNAMT